jgi:serine/threonine-protein kinase
MLRKLEKYDVLEEIGHGGMATVYRAHDTVLDRPVALKVMHPHLRGAEEARRRFHREARSVARLRHPRVLEIYDFSGEGSSEAYIAAELLTGPTLKQWREQQKDVPAEVAAAFTIEIAKALEAAHAAGIVHRDVKPENVLLHENRTLKLTDFGIADMIDAQSMTATGQILGSPGHMAPEQIEGKDCDARTDLFSLGTVLYYLSTGRLPFTGRNPHQVLKRIVDGEYADPLRVNPTLGGRMRGMIVKALAHDPADRYQTAREMITELEAFVADAGLDGSEALIEQYLAEPEAAGARIRARVIERLIENGARASDAGDVPTALDCYNRVLALDDGNERVLRLIERVGTDRRRRMLLLVGGGLMAFGLVTGAGAWALWPDPPVAPDLRPVRSPAPDAGPPVAVTTRDAGADAALRSLDAGSVDADTREPGDSGRPGRTVDGGSARRPVTPRPEPEETGEPRLVVLQPTPQGVRIGIDGDEPRVFGPDRHSATLTPGNHRFEVIPITPPSLPGQPPAPLYGRQVFQVRIPPGEGRYVLPLELPFAPAAIRVESAVPGEVQRVDGQGRAIPLGPTGELLTVPMGSGRVNYQLRVTAADHVPHDRWVTLVAGHTASLSVVLQPR